MRIEELIIHESGVASQLDALRTIYKMASINTMLTELLTVNVDTRNQIDNLVERILHHQLYKGIQLKAQMKLTKLKQQLES